VSKFALKDSSDALWMEPEPFNNIKVSVIQPGPVSTTLYRVAQAVEETIAKPENTPYRVAFEKLKELEILVARAWTGTESLKLILVSIE